MPENMGERGKGERRLELSEKRLGLKRDVARALAGL